MASEYIRRHILRRPPTQIITTRELLIYGKRSAVDQTTFRMVREKFLIRLARGVFVRSLAANPTNEQIAIAKMAAFGKKLFKYGEDLLVKLKVYTYSHAPDSTFAINRHSTSFGTTESGRIYLKGIGPRKAKLCESAVGQAVYALWHKGYGSCDHLDVAVASQNFRRSEREEFRLAARLMPAWLNELCLFRYPEPKVV